MRGVVDFDIFDEDVAAVDEADESGGEVVELISAVEVPPERSRCRRFCRGR